MTASRLPWRRRARGLTLLELLLGLTVTSLVGLGVASMLTMVGAAAEGARDGRAALMRAHLAQLRLRAYVEPSLAALQHDPAQGFALWLHDENPGDTVNLTELRVFWFDPVAGSLTVERVQFPDGWDEAQRQAADVIVPADSDFFAVITAQRQAGLTVTKTLVEGLASLDLVFNAGAIQEADRLRLSFTIQGDAGSLHEVFLSAGMTAHTPPKA